MRNQATVMWVSDGDTINVRLANGQQHYVRIIGINSPEVYGGTVECGGPAASAALKSLLPKGAKVVLASDPTQDLRDRYGRILRYVQYGRFDAGRWMVRNGHARVYVYGRKAFQRATDYTQVQASAQQKRIGLWKTCPA